MHRNSWLALAVGLLLPCLVSCAADSPTVDQPCTVRCIIFDLSSTLTGDTFYDLPFPSDTRVGAKGLQLAGFPGRQDQPLMGKLVEAAETFQSFALTSTTYFRLNQSFRAAGAPTTTPVTLDLEAFIVDVDPDSDKRGARYPVKVTELPIDRYVPVPVIAVGPPPGLILPAGRRYAAVIISSADQPIAASRDFAALRRDSSSSTLAQALAADLGLLWQVLPTLGLSQDQVAAASVFTVGDPVADLARLSDSVRNRFKPEITDLHVAQNHPRFCELRGQLNLPQFQRGAPPFNEHGWFVFEGDMLAKQGDQISPVVVTLPKRPMPAGGYPLMLYIHGSGGLSSQMVDRGPITAPGAPPIAGQGPPHVVSPLGIAMATMSMPVSPERLHGATDLSYVNFNNLKTLRDTFSQGAIETRLLIDALSRLTVPASALSQCSGMPAGSASIDTSRVVAMGQSMGGSYANMVGAIDPRVVGVIPTGAAGLWSHLILHTSKLGEPAVRLVLGSQVDLSYQHPALQILQLVWERGDPIVYTPRQSWRPLAGHPARDTFQPVGFADSFHPIESYDAMALAYGPEQAGDTIWPSMQQALSWIDRDGMAPYPRKHNRKSDDGRAYTAVITQYQGDGISDAHGIVFQLPQLKRQYACFAASVLAGDPGVVIEGATVAESCSADLD